MSSSQCYYPNGNPVKGEQDIPCGGDSDGCCPLNWACQSNGLCYLANEKYLGRYTCTDKTWKSPGCPQICTYDHTAFGNEAVLECEPNSYCCDHNRPELSGGTKCCDASTSRFFIDGNSSVGSDGQTPTTSFQSTSSSTSVAPTTTSSLTCDFGKSACGDICCVSTSELSITNSATSQPLSSITTSATSQSLSTITTSATSQSLTSITLSESSVSTSSTSSPSLSAISPSSTGSNAIFIDPPSSTTPTPASPTSSPSPSGSKNIAVLAGSAVGGAIGFLLLLSLLFFLYCRRRQPGRPVSPLPPPRLAPNNFNGSGTITPSISPNPTEPPNPNPYDQVFPRNPEFMPATANGNSTVPLNRSPLNNEITPDHDLRGYHPAAQPNLRNPPVLNPYDAVGPIAVGSAPAGAAAAFHHHPNNYDYHQHQNGRDTPSPARPPSYRNYESLSNGRGRRVRRNGGVRGGRGGRGGGA